MPESRPWTEALARDIPGGACARLIEQALVLLDRDPSRPPLFFGSQSSALVGQAVKLAVLDFDHPLIRPLIDSAMAFAERGLRELPAQDAEVQDPLAALGRAQCWHARAMGEALLNDSPIGWAALEQAHAHYRLGLQQASPLLAKEHYLPALQGGAELFIAAGYSDLADQLLQVPPPFAPCTNRHFILGGLVTAIRNERGKAGAKPGESSFGALLGKLGKLGGLDGAAKGPPKDACVLQQGDAMRIVFKQFFELWRAPRAEDWITYSKLLDRVRPAPHPTLATVAHALIEDRYFLGHTVPDWRRVLRRIET
jgi:hypothetical protein